MGSLEGPAWLWGWGTQQGKASPGPCNRSLCLEFRGKAFMEREKNYISFLIRWYGLLLLLVPCWLEQEKLSQLHLPPVFSRSCPSQVYAGVGVGWRHRHMCPRAEVFAQATTAFFLRLYLGVGLGKGCEFFRILFIQSTPPLPPPHSCLSGTYPHFPPCFNLGAPDLERKQCLPLNPDIAIY